MGAAGERRGLPPTRPPACAASLPWRGVQCSGGAPFPSSAREKEQPGTEVIGLKNNQGQKLHAQIRRGKDPQDLRTLRGGHAFILARLRSRPPGRAPHPNSVFLTLFCTLF